MKLQVLAVSLLLAGCFVRSPADEAEEKREQEHQRRLLVRQENRQREADETAAIRANAVRVVQEQRATIARARDARTEKERLACEETRPSRLAEREAYQKSLERRHELQEWEAIHCKWVERPGAPTVVLSQDSAGEYHLRGGRSNAVDRKCNAPLPKELEHLEASDVFVRQPSYALGCEKWDAEATR